MLFKIAFKNIKKSIKDYAIYFFTLVLGVAVFYVFNSMESSSSVVMLSDSKMEIVKLLVEMLQYLSIFVVVVLGCLIVYASRFLMKRRKKEFGTYMLLGMSKKTISSILLWETLMVGFLSLCFGLLVGVLLSQFMSLFIAGMFEANMDQFVFTFSSRAFVQTLIYFSVIYAGVMVIYTFSISRTKLIRLIQANKQNESIKIKNTWVCLILFIISIAILGYAYFLVTENVVELRYFSDLIKPVSLGVIGTFLFFYSLSGFVLKVSQSNKRFYYRNVNMFVVRQLHAKANTTVFSMTIISLMLFITICVLSSGLALNQSMTQDLNTYAPADVHLSIYHDEMKAQPNDLVSKAIKNAGFDKDEDFKDYVVFELSYDENLTYDKTIPSYKTNKSNFVQEEIIMGISQYNALAKIYGQPTYTLSDDEYIVIADFDPMVELRDEGLQRGKEITVANTVLKSRFDECKKGFIEMAPSPMCTGVYLLPDKVVESLPKRNSNFVANYRVESEKEIVKMDDRFNDIHSMVASSDNEKGVYYSVSTKTSIYESSVGMGAITTFIGLYLGIVFLICSAAVLALKELSESTDNKERFAILRKIGVDEKMINHSLRTQIAIFFFTPLALAIVHSYFGIRFASLLLPIKFDERIIFSIACTAAILVIVYGGYFLLTYLTSKKIIQEK